MVAPEPFFSPRGTPLSVLHRVEALTALGHRVQLLTYPFGETPRVPGLTVERSATVPGVRDVAVGPSLGKLLLDVPLFRRACRRARDGGFDLVHTHEEAAVAGGWIARRHGVPHLYDMHSSLPEQLGNFARYDVAPLVALFRGLEKFALRHADGVIAISGSLARHARETGYSGPLEVIENVMGGFAAEATAEQVRAARDRLTDGDGPLVVYTGTLEPYQGIELLLAAAGRTEGFAAAARFGVVGGTEAQVERLRREARRRGVASRFSFLPAVPVGEVAAFQAAADVLVSPRRTGTNPPLKIYEYLRSGRPIVATDIVAHSQVLNEDTAEMVAPDAGSIASGIERLLADPERARRLAENAGALARERFGERSYREGLSSILAATLGRS